MAAGGQGAPLVSLLDYVLFADAKRGRVLQNIGGIANLTAIPAGAGPERVVAFDTGPGNMVMDALAQELFGKAFDRNGALAAAGTVAVILPGAFYYLRETKVPPIAALRELGVPLALATDSNPGTSPLTSPLLAMNLACTLFGLTPDEALRGFTVHGARALGLSESIGTLAPGRKADFTVWNADHPAQLVAGIGANPGATVVVAGRTQED